MQANPEKKSLAQPPAVAAAPDAHAPLDAFVTSTPTAPADAAGGRGNLHPDFTPAPAQLAKLASLRARLNTAIAAPSLLSTSRARRMRDLIDSAVRTQDRKIVGQFIHAWELAIEGELRTLGRAALREIAA